MQRLGIACLTGMALIMPVCAEKSSSETIQAEVQSAQLIELFDLVLSRHVSPPTMQQMVLESIAVLYGTRDDLDMLPEIAGEVSATADRDQLRAILERELIKIPPPAASSFASNLPHGLHSIDVRVTPTGEQRVREQLAANRYVGIGIQLSWEGTSELPVMHKIFADGPADAAGAEQGDSILSVDGNPTKSTSIEQVVRWLRGREGTEVAAVLGRNGDEIPVTMTRGVVPIATVMPPIFNKSKNAAGIKIERVSASNVHELRKIRNELPDSVETIVLDLRTTQNVDNLHYGKLLGSALIDGEQIGWVANQRTGEKQKVVAESGALFPEHRLMVVVDMSTRGVLKWIAAALKDSKQAIVIGEVASLAATVSEIMETSDGGLSVSMPVSVLCRADGSPLTGTRTRALRLLEVADHPGPRTKPAGVLVPDRPLNAMPGDPRRTRTLKAILESPMIQSTAFGGHRAE